MRRILEAVKPARLQLSRPRLEDIFIGLVTGAEDAAERRDALKADLTDNGVYGANA
jgi:hypothetical protein